MSRMRIQVTKAKVKQMVVKQILPVHARSEEFIKMFIDEAKIVGQLSHTNICQIFELGKIDNLLVQITPENA